MPLQLRLAVILSAAVIAGAVHHRYLNQRLETQPFVAARRALSPGLTIKDSDLAPLTLGGPFTPLQEPLVPWDDRMLIVGSQVRWQYKAGELLLRRDVEQDVLEPYKPSEGEYVFTVDLPPSIKIMSRFNIGSEVGFLIAASDSADARDLRQCGPFVLRQIGQVSKRVTPHVMRGMPTDEVTLTVPLSPNGGIPDLAKELVNATQGDMRIVGLYDPRQSR